MDQLDEIDIACPYVHIVEDDEGGWLFTVGEEGEVRFKSISCNSRHAVATMLEFLLTHFRGKEDDAIWFKAELDPCGEYYNLVRYCRKVDDGKIVGRFNSLQCVAPAMEMLGKCADAEGFHVIEHVLLRKLATGNQFLDVQLNTPLPPGAACPTDYCVEVKDPYSFRLTVVLPSWPERFNNVNFRNFVEDTLRKEAPAHIYLHICWIGYESMIMFERCLKEWRKQLAIYLQSRDTLCTTVPPLNTNEAYSDALNKLIDKLNGLEHLHPIAQLHDCSTPPGESIPVILGKTNLSSLE